MERHHARVYLRTYAPDEVVPEPELGNEHWREAETVEFVHDAHSQTEDVWVAEPTQEAVIAALQQKHPYRQFRILKVNWLRAAPL